MKPSPKRGSDKINMLKKERKTAEEKKWYHTAWTHLLIPALREEDLESSTKRGANRTKALVSHYWSPQSLHPKEILSDCLRLEKSPTKSLNPMLFSISKHSFPKIQGQLMPMTGVISRVITPKDKTTSNPLARLKVRIFSKSVVSFLYSDCIFYDYIFHFAEFANIDARKARICFEDFVSC